MLDTIRGLIINLSAIVILATLVDIMLPENSYRKYTNFVFGLILLVALLKPVLDIFGNTDALDDMIFNNSIKLEKQIISRQAEVFQQAQDEQIVQTYKNNLETSIAFALNNTFELQNTNVQITFSNAGEIIDSKEISKMEIKSEKKAIDNGVKPIIIGLNHQDDNDPHALDESEIDSIKAYISDLYGLKPEYIFIND